MSGESDEHAALVSSLAATVRERHGATGNLALYLDDNNRERERPQRVGGHLPDLYAENVPRTFVVIGEAKTGADLTTPRSRRQLLAFLHYLKLYDTAYFYLAVPVLTKPAAFAILHELGCKYETVKTHVLPVETDY